jgi:hypothetical protein
VHDSVLSGQTGLRMPSFVQVLHLHSLVNVTVKFSIFCQIFTTSRFILYQIPFKGFRVDKNKRVARCLQGLSAK